jgi:molybdate transport system ATP-binding protein
MCFFVMDAPLIEFDNIDVSLNGRRVLRNISWQLCNGQHWAVSGANGAGKSTFLKLIRAEIAPVPRKGQRIYRLDGRPQRTAVGVKERIPLISPEAQDRYLQLEWKRHVGEVIHSGFGGTDYIYGRLRAAQRELAAQWAEEFGINHLWRRNVQELSTGELRRVLIVRAVVGRPPVLLLDEACDGLDAPTRQVLLRALSRVAGSGTQLIYTTHRGEFIPVITQELRLSKGLVTYQGRAKQTAHRPAGEPRRAGSRRKAPVETGPLIRIEAANVYLERRRVLQEITWEMREGENWAIFGANGSGKSTFLKLVCGDLHAASGGRVQRFGFTARNTLWDIRKRIGFISPALQANYREQLTGAAVVASGFFSSIGLRSRVTKAQGKRVDALLKSFRSLPLGKTPVLEMSYGEFRKLLLLRALVHSPTIVVCDEPFDGLDAEARKAFSAALERVANNGTRLMTVTHHIRELPQCITHALVLEKGRIVCQGKLERVRRHPKMERLLGDE